MQQLDMKILNNITWETKPTSKPCLQVFTHSTETIYGQLKI